MSLPCGWMGWLRLFSQSSRRKDRVCSADVKQVMGKPSGKGRVNSKAAALKAHRLRAGKGGLWGLLSVSWGAETPRDTSVRDNSKRIQVKTQLRGEMPL